MTDPTYPMPARRTLIKLAALSDVDDRTIRRYLNNEGHCGKNPLYEASILRALDTMGIPRPPHAPPKP